MAKRAIKITIEAPQPKMARVAIMHSRTHGVKSRRTERRQYKANLRNGRED